MKSMGNEDKFRELDEEVTKEFLEETMKGFSGDRALDIRGGIDRNGKLLAKYFKKIDIIDLEPEFRTTPLEK